MRSVIAQSILGTMDLDTVAEGDDEDNEDEDAEDYRLVKKSKHLKSVVGTTVRGTMRGTVRGTMRGSVRGSVADVDRMLDDADGNDDVDEFGEAAGGNGGFEDAFELIMSPEGKLTVRAKEASEGVRRKAQQKGGNSATQMEDEEGDVEGKGGSAKMRQLLQEKNAAQKQQLLQKRLKDQQKKQKFQLKTPGAEYKAKNAGGDVWRKHSQQLQPHAYIPLDPRLLSKKHQATAVTHFGSVIGSQSSSNKKNGNSDGRRKLRLPSNKRK